MNHVITVRNRTLSLPNTLNLISHSQALDTISFDVDAEWNGFRKIAVFKAGHDAPVEVAVGTNVTIPAEVLRKTGYIVIGLYGTKDEKIMPTLWSDRICVDIGTDTNGVGATPATAPLYEQALNKAEQAVATVQGFDSRITSAQNAASAAQSAVASKADATTVSALAQTVSGKAESSAVSALATEVSEALAGKQDTIADLSTIRSNAAAVSGKQDAIADLDSIRSGADLGATALQEHQSLAAYRTADEQDAIHDASKQDVIADLSAIRSGASAGATALQSVPNTYRTASAQDALIDSNFKTAATSATAPAFTNDEKAAACSRIGAASQGMVSDAYNASTAYGVGDYCIYNNSLWKCKSACTGVQPIEGANWKRCNAAHEFTNDVKLIADVTISEHKDTVEISSDESSNQFSLSEMYLYVVCAASSGTGVIAVAINNTGGAYSSYNVISISGAQRAQNTFTHFHIKRNATWCSEAYTESGNGYDSTSANNYCVRFNGASNIRILNPVCATMLSFSATNGFESGSRFVVYGR